MPIRSAPAPVKDPIALPPRGLISQAWIDFFTSWTSRVDQTSAQLETVSLTDQSASIGTTAIPLGSLAPGLYRVSWYARITRAATTSSSLTVTIGWTESGVSLSTSGAAMTGNTTATVQSGSVVIRIDQASSILYSTTYASVGGTSMQYRLDLIVEQLGT